MSGFILYYYAKSGAEIYQAKTMNGWIFLCIHGGFLSIRVEMLIQNLGIYKKDRFVGNSHAIVHSKCILFEVSLAKWILSLQPASRRLHDRHSYYISSPAQKFHLVLNKYIVPSPRLCRKNILVSVWFSHICTSRFVKDQFCQNFD